MGRRIRWLGILLILCFGLVIVQLTNIQFRKATTLATSPDNPVNRAPDFDNDRGSIFASDGTLLAESVRIAPKGGDTYQFQRNYPTKALFSQIVGVCAPFPASETDQVGCNTGIEGYYSSTLGLHKQSAQTLSQLLSPPPPTTDDITLTVVPAIQQEAVNELNSLSGPNKDAAIVVLVPSTGAILAMASTPTFDPTPLVSTDTDMANAALFADSVHDSEGFQPYYPIATYNAILPGSTAKVITTAAIFNLDPSLATYNYPQSLCQPLPDSDKQICNDADSASQADPCGGTIVQMLPQSCDPGYAQLGLLLGGDRLAEQATLFGFNSKPPIDLPSGYVAASQYPTASDMSTSCTPSPECVGLPGQAYSAFGQQNVAATALQNALVAAGIANGGAIMVPHLLEKITNAQGQVVETYQPKVWKQAISPQAAAQVTPLMQSVNTAPGATARGEFPQSLDVAIKTGTAQFGTPESSVQDWMIGFAPASSPKVAIAVVVPYQPLSTAGASVAGPIVRAMLEAIPGT